MAKKTTGTAKRRGRKSKAQLEQERAEREQAELLLQQKQKLKEERNQIIAVLILSAIALIGYMEWGLVGYYLSRVLCLAFGKFYYMLIMLIIIQILIMIINRRSGNTTSKNPFALILVLVILLLSFSYFATDKGMKGFEIVSSFSEEAGRIFSDNPPEKVGGGIIGAALLSLTTWLVDWRGTMLIIVVLSLIAAVLLVNLQVYKQFFATVKKYFVIERDAGQEEEPDHTEQLSLRLNEPDSAPKEEAVLTPIQADGLPREKEPEPVMAESLLPLVNQLVKEPVSELRPIELRSSGSFGITLDDPVSEKEPDQKKTDTIFMNVDELVDRNALRKAASVEPEEMEEESCSGQSLPPVTDIRRVREEIELPVSSGSSAVSASEDEMRPIRSNRPYHLPKFSLLDPIPPKSKEDLNEKAAAEKGSLLVRVLRNFDIETQLVGCSIGPSVTKFEIRPDANVKVSKISNLADDIKMQLAVRDVRIEAPIPGYNAVGIEIPNIRPVPVKMRELVSHIPEKDKDRKLLVVLGKDVMGHVITCRLDKMPHLLIAGATGSGKSVCMNSIIVSLLLRTRPDEVKLLLIDPKKVEFTPYRRIPHLIGPVINDSLQASTALKAMVQIMDDRYQAFADIGVRNIEGFNTKVEGMAAPQDGSPKPKKMPYIVVIIDELADLMTVAGKEVESSIQRLTQLARAAGIHLIVATQRPSVDVITGVIKSNIPSRIAFSVSSSIDSRTILDHVGAERLLGNGDMLYFPTGESGALRVQGVFVTDEEVQRVTDYCSGQQAPFYDDVFVRLDEVGVGVGDGSGGNSVSSDPLYQEVKDYVIEVQKASTSLVQRRFGIGYNRAARYIDTLEEEGIIGPSQGSKPRDVYIKRESH